MCWAGFNPKEVTPHTSGSFVSALDVCGYTASSTTASHWPVALLSTARTCEHEMMIWPLHVSQQPQLSRRAPLNGTPAAFPSLSPRLLERCLQTLSLFHRCNSQYRTTGMLMQSTPSVAGQSGGKEAQHSQTRNIAPSHLSRRRRLPCDRRLLCRRSPQARYC